MPGISPPALPDMCSVDMQYLLLFVLAPVALLLGCTLLFGPPIFDSGSLRKH